MCHIHKNKNVFFALHSITYSVHNAHLLFHFALGSTKENIIFLKNLKLVSNYLLFIETGLSSIICPQHFSIVYFTDTGKVF